MSDARGPRTVILGLTVVTENPEAAVKTWDVIGRMAVGLALDGIHVGINIGTVELDDEDEDEDVEAS